MGRTIGAVVTFLTPEEGGRSTAAASGFRPQLKIGDFFTSTVVSSVDGRAVFRAGSPERVHLDVVFFDRYSQMFDPGAPVELYEGDKLIATGRFELEEGIGTKVQY